MRRRIVNQMKRLEIVIEHAQLARVRAVLDEHATGYTVVSNVTGFGHHGCREGGLVMVVTVVTHDHVDPILDALPPVFNERCGIVVMSDVGVLNSENFVPELKHRPPVLPRL
jgi:nitrogen regulatory protein PII